MAKSGDLFSSNVPTGTSQKKVRQIMEGTIPVQGVLLLI